MLYLSQDRVRFIRVGYVTVLRITQVVKYAGPSYMRITSPNDLSSVSTARYMPGISSCSRRHM